MVPTAEFLENEAMSNFFSPQNRGHILVIAIALIARAVLGAIPFIGWLFSFVLLLVVLFHGYKVATNMINATPA